jgi:hypothetical protein
MRPGSLKVNEYEGFYVLGLELESHVELAKKIVHLWAAEIQEYVKGIAEHFFFLDLEFFRKDSNMGKEALVPCGKELPRVILPPPSNGAP